MDPLIPVVASILILGAALGAALAALFLLHRSIEAERAAWAGERYDLNVRIQTPELAPLLPKPSALASERPAEKTPEQQAAEAEAAAGYAAIGTVV